MAGKMEEEMPDSILYRVDETNFAKTAKTMRRNKYET